MSVTPNDLAHLLPVVTAIAPHSALLNGDIILKTRAHSAWGGAVTAQMYVPLTQIQVWQHLTDYSRWPQYFPDMTRSEVLQHPAGSLKRGVKRLYQAASKAFLFFSAQVEVYLQVLETHQQRIQFVLESGSFRDFTADVSLQACGDGTILTYSVQATPTIPVPSLLIQQAIQMDLPNNMRQMRRVMCGR